MQPSKTLRVLLVLSGLMAVVIGASILVAPGAFHASYGTELGSDANLLSEIRAPGGALMVLGLLMGLGAFVPRLTYASTVIAAAVYLAYGASRLVSIGLDGMPVDALLGATAIEFVVGSACLVALVRAPRAGQEA
ncbi:MAG: DUF4345 domain-containing protein [Planctomycetota bacterium]|nr:DUF4345 domain-containing protein [Planctomycetota bacterium]